MKTKNILNKIHKIEKDYEKLNHKLSKCNLLKSKKNSYLSSDKKEFLDLWEKYISFFKELRYLINKNNYRTFFVFIDYNKLLIRRYLLIFYFNSLVDLVNNFWKHEDFIRLFLSENFKYDFGKVAKFIYRPSYINLLNTPIVFLWFINKKIDKRLSFMLKKDKNFIWKNKRFLTDYKNFYFYIKRRWYKILFYLSEKAWRLIARTKFSNRKKWLISIKNIKKYLKIAKPWDVFLTRWNWNASNITIPWFWKHMSMYLWTWKFLKNNYWKDYDFINNFKDSENYVIEATWDWVVIKEINDFIYKNDYLWVSRTKFSKEKIDKVLYKALSYYWFPYDYIFNFYSNNNVVCSELVLKSYSKDTIKDEWLEFRLEKIKWSLTYPPNNFVKQVFNKNENLKFIFFIDSIEKTWENFISNKKEFEKSGNRSRFSFMLK